MNIFTGFKYIINFPNNNYCVFNAWTENQAKKKAINYFSFGFSNQKYNIEDIKSVRKI